MNNTKASIIITIFFSSGRGEKHYTVSSIDAFLLNLEKFHKIKIKRRWIFYCFRYLLDAGYIKRKARYANDGNGLITQIPSMVTFTLRGVIWLVSKGVTGAKKIYKSMMSYIKKDDGRFPAKKDFDDGSFWPEDPAQRNFLMHKLGIVMKPIGQK